MSKSDNLSKVFQIHLLLNQAMFIFEDLPANDKFFIENKEVYEHCVRLSEELTAKIDLTESNNYNYTLERLKKVVTRIRLIY